MIQLSTFRHHNHLFGSPFRLGQDEAPPEPDPEPAPEPEPEPEPAPPPPPVTTCKSIGKPFVESGICYQMFECKTNGTVTYEKRNSACPPGPQPWNIYYPYYHNLYPVTAYPVVAPTEIKIEDSSVKATTLKEVAPYAVGAVAVGAILYALLK